MLKSLKFILLALPLFALIAFIGTTFTNLEPDLFTPLEQQSKTLIDKKAIEQLQNQAHEQLATGWAKYEITPPIGTATLGYGDRQAQGATQSDGPLFATAFVLQAGNQSPVVLLTADICFWPNKLSKQLALRLADVLPRERLFFGATHTHDGPGSILDAPLLEIVFGNYSDAVAEKILTGAENAVRMALANLEEGRIRVHEIAVPELVSNRTSSIKPVSSTAVVELEQTTGKKALLVTYSAHATLIAPYPVVSSANYPGSLNNTLESKGWELSGFFAAETAQAGPSIDGEIAQAPGVELAHRYGAKLANKIANKIKNSQQRFEPLATIQTLRSPIFLPEWGFRLPFLDLSLRPFLTTALLSGQVPDAHIHGLEINELILIGHGFELSAEHGYRVRQLAKQQGKVLVPLSFNGEHHFYVVPESSYHESGYEPSMAFFGPHLADYLDNLNIYLLEVFDEY